MAIAKKKKTTTKKPAAKKPYVIVRSHMAGVHCGVLERRDGQELTLSDARRVYSWAGAKTLSNAAVDGFGSGSRIAPRLDKIDIHQWFEIIPCTPEAEARIRDAEVFR